MKRTSVDHLTLDEASRDFADLDAACRVAQQRFNLAAFILVIGVLLASGAVLWGTPPAVWMTALAVLAIVLPATTYVWFVGKSRARRREKIGDAFGLERLAEMSFEIGQAIGDQIILESSVNQLHLVARRPFALEMVRRALFLAASIIVIGLFFFLTGTYGYVLRSSSGVMIKYTGMMWLLPLVAAGFAYFAMASCAIQWFVTRADAVLVIEKFRFARQRQAVEVPLTEIESFSFSAGALSVSAGGKEHVLIRFEHLEMGGEDSIGKANADYHLARCTHLIETIEAVAQWQKSFALQN